MQRFIRASDLPPTIYGVTAQPWRTDGDGEEWLQLQDEDEIAAQLAEIDAEMEESARAWRERFERRLAAAREREQTGFEPYQDWSGDDV